MSQNSDSVRPVAVVTGGSRGIGRNTVISLAKNGVDSIFTYLASRDEAEKVTNDVRTLGRSAVALALDVTDTASFDAFADRVREALATLGIERFDFLVNNAGTSLRGVGRHASLSAFGAGFAA